MYSTNNPNGTNSFGGNGTLRPLNRLKDPYADSLLFGNDTTTVPVSVSSSSFQGNSSLGLSPIKNNQPSSKKPSTPSFERSFEVDVPFNQFHPNQIHPHHLSGNNLNHNTTTRRTVLEVNMKGRKQPPLSSSIFADHAGFEFNSNPAVTANNQIHHSLHPTITPQTESHRVRGGAPVETTPTDAAAENSNTIRSIHPYLSLAKISPAMDRLETIWSTWIIVYGYDPRIIQLHDILYHFQQYGEIVKQYSSQQNWILLKFDSPVEAERATIQPCFFLPNHQTLLAVHRMNHQLAKSLQLLVTSDGTIISSTDPVAATSSTSMNSPSATKIKPPPAQLEELRPFLSPNNGSRVRKRSNNGISASHSTASIEPDIYIKPKRQKNICERIVDYFWSS